MNTSDEVWATIQTALFGGGLLGLITMIIVIWRLVKALHECHLGPNALDPDTGMPRWWNTKASDALIQDLKDVLENNTRVMKAVLDEIVIDRRVRKEVAEQRDGQAHDDQNN